MNIKDVIKKLELELLKPEIRKDKKRLGELLADDFIEIASVGIILRKKDILKRLPREDKIKWKILNFQVKEISKDVVLVSYKAIKNNLETGESVSSFRSSLWKKEGKNWRMVFHQGTLLEK